MANRWVDIWALNYGGELISGYTRGLKNETFCLREIFLLKNKNLKRGHNHATYNKKLDKNLMVT